MRKIWRLRLLAISAVAVSVCADVAQAQTAGFAELRARAEQGDAEAQFSLGRMYGKGDGIPQDGVQAVAWFRKAAEQGHAKAQNGLGVMYASGLGVPQDWVQAVMWFRKAAEQGEPMAQCNLGVRYDNGQGVPRDLTQAAAWYRKGAEQGYAEAQSNLAALYIGGEGVPQDYSQAFGWYRKSAEQRYASAQFNLGTMYLNGHGVPQDLVEAHKWMTLAAAAATGEDQLKVFTDGRDSVAKSMEPAQLAEAARRAQEWTDAFERRTAQATPVAQVAQPRAEPARRVLQLASVTVTPGTVVAGQPFSLVVAYTATDPTTASGKAAVTMSFSVLSSGTSMLDVPGEIVESDSGQPWKITKPLTAAAAPGAYVIRISLALGATVVTRDVEFTITR